MSTILSECRQYRYQLYRPVDMFGTHLFAYFGINPSTADEDTDDQTVKKWIGFTMRNGGHSFLVGNVFGYRATDVNDLAKAEDPVGVDNSTHLASIIQEADILVPCWGSRNKVPQHLQPQINKVLEMLASSGKPVRSFGTTADGDPKHPLMLPYEEKLIPFNTKSYLNGSAH